MQPFMFHLFDDLSFWVVVSDVFMVNLYLGHLIPNICQMK